MASREATIRSIRKEWAIETGEDPGRDAADVILDQMCCAFGEKVAGAGYEYAVQQDRRTAEYLQVVWTGEERKKLKAALASW